MDDEDGRNGEGIADAPAWRRPLRGWLAAALYLAALLASELAQTAAIIAESALVLWRTSERRRVRREKAWR
jgi:hypothetical protein